MLVWLEALCALVLLLYSTVQDSYLYTVDKEVGVLMFSIYLLSFIFILGLRYLSFLSDYPPLKGYALKVKDLTLNKLAVRHFTGNIAWLLLILMIYFSIPRHLMASTIVSWYEANNLLKQFGGE